MIYFDHNATSPLLPSAGQLWLEASQRWPGNPSSLHRLGSRASTVLEEARQKLATILGCDALDLVFTSGATESNNQVLTHVSRTLPGDQQIWLSAVEHPSVLGPARFYFPNRVRWIPASRNGRIQAEILKEWLRQSRPGLVGVMAANNETGVLQPWQQIQAWCAAQEIPFFCDATQWLGKLPAAGLGACDFLSGCAHKFGGPRGVGFLKCPSRGPVTPLIRGGPQEEGRRGGTENLPGALALVQALQTREEWLAKSGAVMPAGWRDEFEQRVSQALPGLEIVGQAEPRLWNTVAALFPQQECQQRWVVKLDRQGCAVSTGSACASGKEETSHVLRAMGFSEGDASRMIRISAGWETTAEDWSQLLEAIRAVHETLSTPAS